MGYWDPSGREFSVGGLGVSMAIGAGLGGVSGAAIGAAHGAIRGGLEGALLGAGNGFLWGLAAGASIGGGGYALGCYFISLGTPMVQAYGSATFIAGLPWQIVNSIGFADAIQRQDAVDIAFSTLGFVLGYLPVAEGTQFNAFIGGYLRSLPFVKDFTLISRTEANAGTGGGGWNVAFAKRRLVARITLSQNKRFVRVIKTGAKPEGAWVALESDLVGKTPAQIKDFLGLRDVPDAYLPVNVPPSTAFEVGQAGPQPTWGVMKNGGLQFRITSTTDPAWFGTPKPLGPRFRGIR